MRILLTGAGGFIGLHVSRKLVEAGQYVIRIVRPGGRSEKSVCQETIQVQLEELNGIPRAFKGKVDILVHLAAVVPSSFNGTEAIAAAKINKRIDENVFLACKELGIGAVYASGSSVYGLGTGQLMSELSPCSPIGPYAAAKLVGEQKGEQTLTPEGLPFTALRINAPYGPEQRAQTVLNLFLQRALKGLPLLYHGTGSRQQDFTHVDDVADAVLRAVINGESGIYNISGGHPIGMKQLAELVVRCTESASYVGPSGEPDLQEGATALYDIERAINELHWRPQVPLESGIRNWADRLKNQHENRTSI
jgi:UDP-glucose 4-epimerase